MAAVLNVKTTDPMDDTNHRGDLERQFRNQDHLQDERFDAVLTHTRGLRRHTMSARSVQPQSPITHKMSEMKTSQFDTASDDLAMSEKSVWTLQGS
jgi:hypothetical protein